MKIVILRKRMIILSSILLLSLFCHSCCAFPVIPTTVSYRGPIDDEALSFLQGGVTTKEDVLLKLGNPTYCFEDEESFDYCWEILHGVWFAGAGLSGVGGPIGKKHCLSLEFDEHGILTKYEVKRNAYLEGENMGPNCR